MAEKILIITPVPIVPSYSGNKKRILSICTELKNLGFELDLFYTGFEDLLIQDHDTVINGEIFNHSVNPSPISFRDDPKLRIQELINGLRVKVDKVKRFLNGGVNSSSYNKSIYEYRNVKKLELIKKQIFETEYRAVIVNYAVYTHFFDFFDDHVRKIVDLHDCLTDRYKLFLKNGDEPVNWYSLSYNDEKHALKRADIVWAITPGEKEHYHRMLHDSGVEVESLRHIISFRRIEALTVQKKVLMTGSDNKLNRIGLKWFLGNIWHEVIAKYPDAELIIAGSICKSSYIYENVKGISIHGGYGHEEEVYSLADICINPMLEGTGLKIKTLEALAFGKRVLSTSEGATGLTDLINAGLFCSDEPVEWIDEFDRIFGGNVGNDEFLISLENRIQKIYDQNINVLKKSLS